MPEIVSVKKGEKLGPGDRGAMISCGRSPGILLPNKQHSVAVVSKRCRKVVR